MRNSCKDLEINLTTAGCAIDALKKAIVIDYESVTNATGNTQVSYSLGELPINEILPYSYIAKGRVVSYMSLTRKIANICQKISKDGLLISQKNVYLRLPQKLRMEREERSLRYRISGVLSHLARINFLERGRFSGVKGGETYSWAKIKPRGELVVSKFLEPLWDLVNDDEEVKTRIEDEVVARVLANLSQYTATSTDLYYPYSIGFKMRQREENMQKILDFLSTSDATAQDLSWVIGLNEVSVRRYMRRLKEEGMLSLKKRKGVFHASLAHSNNQGRGGIGEKF